MGEKKMSFLDMDYQQLKETTLYGRYIAPDHITPLLEKLGHGFVVDKIGSSVQGRDIHTVTLGKGNFKVLLWSQMHGNESTTTKAIFDLLKSLAMEFPWSKQILDHCTLRIIPMLNPDGALAYTRVNANGIDLNRDAQDRSQPESVALYGEYNSFKPDLCFNLHDQRTIFNVGGTSKPATVSFLAPAHDPERSISTSRAASMRLIVAMNTMLQQLIPGQVGRYDDAFNANCVGDAFQMRNTPTILFESGHYYEDYEREVTRRYIYYAMLQALLTVSEGSWSSYSLDAYTEIPENGKQFVDVLIRNWDAVSGDSKVKSVRTIRFLEKLEGNTITFEPQISELENQGDLFGHATYDCLNPKELAEIKQQPYWSKL